MPSKYGRIYQIWRNMMKRCFDNNYKQFHLYGGRGITVCEKWTHVLGFIEDMGSGHRNDLSLERINNDGNYCKSNCRWATINEQQRNKRNNVWIEFGGRKMVLQDWANELGVLRCTLHRRLESGVPVNLLLSKHRLDKPSIPLRGVK